MRKASIMLINAVTYTFTTENAATAADLFVRLQAAALTEPGCIDYVSARSSDDPNTFVLFEKYTDRAALEAHYATAAFKEFGVNGIRPLAASRVGHICEPLVA